MMNSKEASQACIKLCGYGIGEKAVKAIQLDALQSAIATVEDSCVLDEDNRYYVIGKIQSLINQLTQTNN